MCPVFLNCVAGHRLQRDCNETASNSVASESASKRGKLLADQYPWTWTSSVPSRSKVPKGWVLTGWVGGWGQNFGGPPPVPSVTTQRVARDGRLMRQSLTKLEAATKRTSP